MTTHDKNVKAGHTLRSSSVLNLKFDGLVRKKEKRNIPSILIMG